ncbi:putative ribonuclease H-like domain-containing protein [Tanacetum coccineum]
MALPNKDQLKFHSYQDAKLLMKAIEKRYGGNKESKKVQRTLLKQQYENFAALSSESMDQTFDRLQKLIEIETISLDDLYNFLKIYEPELKGSSSTNQNTQNVAFVSNSTKNTNNTHKRDDTAHKVSTTHSTTHTHHNGGSTICVDNLCDAVICAFLASQPNSPQLAQEDLEQLHPDDLSEMDLHWEKAMLTIRARRFIKRTWRKMDINGQRVGFDKSKVECFNCHKHGHFARECRFLRNQESKGRDNNTRTITVETPTQNALIAQDGLGGYDWSYQAEEEQPTNHALMAFTSYGSSFSSDSEVDSCSKTSGLESVEARLVYYKKNEGLLEESIKVLKLEVRLRDNALEEYKMNLEKAKTEKDQLKQTLEKFQKSSKSLNEILECQVIDKSKKGLGYNAATAAPSAVESFVNLTDKSKSDKGYQSVLPPLSGTFVPRKPGLTFIDDIVESENLDVTTVTSLSNGKTVENKGASSTIESNVVRMNNTGALIIEDWNSKDESEIDYTIGPSIENIKTIKTVRETDAHKQNPRGNQRNWNNLMSQRLGSDFKMTNKACYVCGSFKHLHHVCDKKGERPVWNNSRSVNHKNFSNKMTHLHPKRNFVPQAVLTRSGKHSTANVAVNTVRPVNTASTKAVNIVRPVNTANSKADNLQQKEYKEKAIIDNGCSRQNICVSQICDKKNNVLFTDTECLVLSSNFKLLDESQVLLRVPRKDNIYSVDLKSVVPSGDLTCFIAKATIDESNTWHRRLGHINFKKMNKLVKGNLIKGLPSKIFENDHSCVACQKGKKHKASYKTKLVNSISRPLHMLHMDLFGPTNVKSLMRKSYCLVVTDDFSRFSWVFFLATKDETSGFLKTFITEIENQLDHKVKVIRSDNGTKFKNSIMNQFCKIKGIKREFSVARTPQHNGVAERKNRTLIEAARTMLVDSKFPTTFWAEAVNTACYVLNRVLVIKTHNKTPYELIRGRPPLIDFMKPFGCPVTILNTRDHLGKFDGKADEGYFVGYFVVRNKTNGIVGTKDNTVAGPKDRERDTGMKPTEVDENEASATSGKDDKATRSESERLNQREMQTKNTNSTNGINTVSTHVSTAGPTVDTAVSSPPVNTARPSVNTANAFEEHLFERFSLFKNAFSLPPVPYISSMDNTGIFGNAYDDENVEEEVDMNNVNSSYQVPDTSFTKFHKDHPEDQVIGSLKTPVQTRHMTKTNEEHGMISSVHQLRRTNHKDFQNCLFSCFLSQKEPKKTLVDFLRDKWAIGTKWVFRNKKNERGIVVKNKARLVAQGHTQEEGIDYDEVFAPVARIGAIRLFLAYASFKDFVVYQMDVKSSFLYGKIEEEVYVCHPPRFEDPHFPNKVYKVEKTLYGLHQAPRAWYETLSTYLLDNGFHRGQIDKTLFIRRHKDDILLVQKSDGIFISQDKYVAEILKKFDFASIKTASTLIETNKPLIKDEEADNVDVHLYRSVIGSLMYLTTSRPYIMFAVFAYARFQVTPKTSHLHAVKRIFSDYAGASLDMKSTTGGCQFLGKRLISWQCKKQTIVANSTTEAEYVGDEAVHKELGDKMEKASTTASSSKAEQDSGSGPRCQDTILGDVDAQTRFETTSKQSIDLPLLKVNTFRSREDSVKILELMEIIHNSLVDKKKVIITEASIKTDLHLDDAEEEGAEVANDETEQEEYITTPSNDPLPSEKAKIDQATEIASLKKRVNKLEKRRQLRTTGLKRFKKLGTARRVKSFNVGLGAQEDASKQGRILDDDEVFVDVPTSKKDEQGTKLDDSTAGEVTAAKIDELTLAQALIEIKAAKPKVVTTAATTTTTTIPNAKGVVVQEPSEFRVPQEAQPLISKDKGKGIMVEPEGPLERKDQIALDEQIAKDIQAKLDDELEEEQKLVRKQEEEANIALIESWENTQAMMEADRLLAKRL